MNYQEGNEVRLKTEEQLAGEFPTKDGEILTRNYLVNLQMREYLGKAVTIDRADRVAYTIREDGGKWQWTDQMISHKVRRGLAQQRRRP